MDIKELQANKKFINQQNHPWENARFHIIVDIIGKYINDNMITALDLGCGDIFFLNKFSRKFKGIFFAIDTAFDEKIIETLTKKYQNETIIMANALENVFPKKKFDIVFLLDVIEHIEMPVCFLKKIIQSQFIEENSLFIITVPAYQSLFSNHDYWLGHVKRYDKKNLFKEIDEAGLQMVEYGNFFFTLLGIRMIEKQLQKIKNKKTEDAKGISGWNKSVFVTLLYKLFLLSDYYFFGKLLRFLGVKTPGLSFFAVCKLKKNIKI